MKILTFTRFFNKNTRTTLLPDNRDYFMIYISNYMKKTTNVKATLRIYWREVRRYKQAVFLLCVGFILANVGELVTPLYYKKFFDLLAGAVPSQSTAMQLIIVLLWVLFFNGFIFLGYRLSSFINSYVQSHIMADLRMRAFDYLILHSYGFFSNSFSGALVQKINRLARAFETFADRLFWDFMPLIIRVFGAIIILWWYNPFIGIVMLVWVMVFIAVNFGLSIWKLKYDIDRAEWDSKTTASLADAITNHTTIQLFTGMVFESKRFKQIAEKLRDITKKSWYISAIIEMIQSLLFFAIEFLLFFFAIRYWEKGALSLGMFVLIQAYLLTLIHKMWDIGRIIRDTYESFADAKEMVDIMQTPHQVQDMRGAKKLIVTTGHIEFQNVQFSFHKTREVLKSVSLSIAAGEKVALIGPSGAGKTTLVKLLFRFYDIDGGKILVDNQNIARVKQDSLRENISLVPQDTILFHRTILENIRYGRRDASDEEVKKAAKFAHCQEFIDHLADGYTTYVGERGIKLSGGERQRIAIARAILKNAPILVLDEATSSLDSESEMLIQDALEKLMKNKTVIVIAHRLSTIRKMDRIIVIDKGGVLEQGSHADLLNEKTSLYKRLWELQAGGFLISPKSSPR